MKEQAKSIIDKEKCTKCGICINTCAGMVLGFGEDGYPKMKDFERFGWRGYWKCEHCLAVCPKGAISILGKKPEDSLQLPDEDMGEQLIRLVSSRRSCRRYYRQNAYMFFIFLTFIMSSSININFTRKYIFMFSIILFIIVFNMITNDQKFLIYH